MTDVNQKTELGEMSRNWHTRLKEIRLAMVSNQHSLPRLAPQTDDIIQIPADNELFAAGTVIKQLPQDDIFAGSVPLYEPVNVKTNTVVNPVVNPNPAQIPLQPVNVVQPLISPTLSAAAPLQDRRLSMFQVVLIAAIILISSIMILEFVMPFFIAPPQQIAGQMPSSQPMHAEQQNVQVQSHAQVKPEDNVHEQKELTAEIPAPQPMSLKDVQQLYINEDYSKALEKYQKLAESISANPKEELMKDYLQLQIAICTERTGQYNQAAVEFRKVLYSSSPVIRVVAAYHCGLLDMLGNQYLSARTKAYQAIALIDAIDYDKQWAQNLKKDCYFLAAQSLTREILTLCEVDKDQPAELWPSYDAADDLFTSLDETQIRELLNSGSNHLNEAVLGPQIQRFDSHGGLDVYDIKCSGASIEEMLAKFSAYTKIDSKWNFDSNDNGLRKQLIYLYLLSSQSRQFAQTAAASVGLLAHTDDNGLINIYNPSSYSLLSQHLDILIDEAVSQWREFVLRFPDDNRIANVHFAVGLLYTPRNLYTESISEYKLVANRFARSPLAPYALLNLSKIKNTLKDYHGAYEDLRQLVEQFPDSSIATTSALYYADTACKANLLEESARLYRKVYNLALTQDSRFAAAFGAGKSSFLIKDYETAENWLTKYTKLAVDTPGKDLYMAYLYLAKTYLAQNKPDLACTSFRYAVLGAPFYLPKEEYIEIIPVIVDTYMKQGSFVLALSLIESVDTPSLTPNESVQLLLMQSKLLRSMGLIDKALLVFGDRVEYTFDPELKAKIYFELSQSYIEKGDLNSASKLLSDIIILVKPGDLMNQAALKLAQVCLDLGNNNQAISVTRQLLSLEPRDDVKQKALQLLAAAYKQNKNYDSAALALVGQWK
ncbi:MAG: tetratricopeptide repeat protein [Phycisphaerales bacterium]